MVNIKIAIYSILILCSTSVAFSQEKQKPLKDTLDNAFDISNYLFNLHGFLPIVSPITEPAVGYGAVVAGAFFIPKKDTKKGEFRMPDIAAAMGGYTENGTWFAGAAYFGYWNKDKIRYRGILAYADVNLKYYGNGNPILSEYPAKFSLKAFILLQQATFRIGKSNFFLGGKYLFTKTEVTLFEESIIPDVNPCDFDLISSGIGVISEYENFNNLLSPTKGFRVHLDFIQYHEIIGSDRNYGRLTLFTHMYFPVSKIWIPGFRVESLMATGNSPFYALPYVQLRGVPALRYQGELTMLLETEHLFNITSRWGVVGFAGLGTAFNTLEEMESSDLVWNAGAGFRYLIARLLGLKMGLDVARGPEQWAFYVVVGSSWNK